MTKPYDLFKEYRSSVVTHAVEITTQHTIKRINDTTSELHHYDKLHGETAILFRHFDPVEVGDFIKQLNELDIYHLPRKLFLALYIVNDSPFEESVNRGDDHVTKLKV